jgi:hypothetical protein
MLTAIFKDAGGKELHRVEYDHGDSFTVPEGAVTMQVTTRRFNPNQLKGKTEAEIVKMKQDATRVAFCSLCSAKRVPLGLSPSGSLVCEKCFDNFTEWLITNK